MKLMGKIVPSLAAAVVLCGATAHAQTTFTEEGFDLQQFAPTPSQTRGYFTQSTALPLSHLQWEFGVLANYADDPLVVSDTRSSDPYRSIVERQLTLNVLFGIGIADVLELAVDVPVHLMMSGEEDAAGGAFNDPADASAGLGDVRFVPKVTFINGVEDDSPAGFVMGLLADVRFPTGDVDRLQGEGNVRIEPRLLADYYFQNSSSVGANIGYRFGIGEEGDFANVDVQDFLTYSGAARIQLFDNQTTEENTGAISGTKMYLVPEIYGAAAMRLPDGANRNVEETPLEALLGLKFFATPDLLIEAGGGAGLIQGAGVPDWRVFLGLAYSPADETDCLAMDEADCDGDTLINIDDECPADPEDFDGFEDENGCPDPDNDGDGIPDIRDGAVDESGFGICRDNPEDMDGNEDEDGCPETEDRDGDGYMDDEDECPDEPEDFDGFEDEEGCPDPDNDGDGVLDVDDGEADENGFGVCRDNPEDMDGFEDEDGCPDPDNDQDRILDVNDECPDDPEVYNGLDDEDGCPDENAIELTCAGVRINEQVYFHTASHVIQTRSYSLLNDVSAVIVGALDTYPDVRIVVEGHTDSRGGDRYNEALSDRRANSVREYLTDRGVPAEALRSIGYGETRPIDTNDTADGRRNNRRVEFNVDAGSLCPEGQTCVDNVCEPISQ